jgi:hypothetical protein
VSTEAAATRPPRWLPAATLLLSALVFAGFLRFMAQGFPHLNDFHVLWSAARFLQQGVPAEVYDLAVFDAFREGQGDAHFSHLPFLYPPCAALLLLPLGALPYGTALLAWSLLSLGLYLAAMAWVARPLRLAVPAALVAPAGVACLLAGQTGLLLGALVLLGAGLLQRRPLLAGIAFGLMAFKPQLALLPGLALLLAGHWRTAGVAAFTAVVLVAASLLVFGFAAWPAWLHQLAGFNSGLDSSGSHQQYGVSTAFALMGLGLSRGPALAAQFVVSVCALGLAARSLRRGGGLEAALPLLPGLLLATPYAAVYDLPALAAACLLLTQRGWSRGFAPGETLLLVLAWLLPLLLLLSPPGGSALALLVIAATFAFTLRRTPAG